MNDFSVGVSNVCIVSGYFVGSWKKYFKANLNFKCEHFRDNVGVQYGHSNSYELALDYAADKGDTIFLLLTTLGVSEIWLCYLKSIIP